MAAKATATAIATASTGLIKTLDDKKIIVMSMYVFGFFCMYGMLVSVTRSIFSFTPLLSHYNPVAWKTLLICSTVLGDVILSLRTK